MAFILTGGIGFVWLFFWFALFKSQKKLLEAGTLTKANMTIFILTMLSLLLNRLKMQRMA